MRVRLGGLSFSKYGLLAANGSACISSLFLYFLIQVSTDAEQEEEAKYLASLALLLRLEEILGETEGKLHHYATYRKEEYEAFTSSIGKAGKGEKRGRPRRGMASAKKGGQVAASSTSVIDAYAEAMREHRFASMELLDGITKNRIPFSLKAEIPNAVVGSAQRRLVRIMHEISSLSTGLPVEYGAGIYCRG